MGTPLISRNLKRLKASLAGTVHHIPHDELLSFLREDFQGFVATSRQVEFETDFDARDMRWNHMDFAHRPWVHGLYNDGLRIAMGKEVCVGITPWPLTPILITTFDLRVSENEFRQMLQIAGLFTIFMRMSIVPQGAGRNTWRLEWSIVSKWYLRPLHGALHARIEKLNRRLFEEDIPVKAARSDLRRRGYQFRDEDQGYHEASVLTSRAVTYPAAPEITVSIAGLRGRQTVQSGPREFVIERDPDGDVLVWDGVCPHQGGPLGCARRERAALTCPWHGLPIAGARLSAGRPASGTATFTATLSGDALTIRPLSGA